MCPPLTGLRFEPVVGRCTLPLTGQRVVSTIITEKGLFEVLPDGKGLRLKEIAEDETVDSIRASTAAEFVVAEDCKPLAQ